jgi:hypothetical protein
MAHGSLPAPHPCPGQAAGRRRPFGIAGPIFGPPASPGGAGQRENGRVPARRQTTTCRTAQGGVGMVDRGLENNFLGIIEPSITIVAALHTYN